MFFCVHLGHPSQALRDHLQAVYAGLHEYVANTKGVLTDDADDAAAKTDATK